MRLLALGAAALIFPGTGFLHPRVFFEEALCGGSQPGRAFLEPEADALLPELIQGAVDGRYLRLEGRRRKAAESVWRRCFLLYRHGDLPDRTKKRATQKLLNSLPALPLDSATTRNFKVVFRKIASSEKGAGIWLCRRVYPPGGKGRIPCSFPIIWKPEIRRCVEVPHFSLVSRKLGYEKSQ